VVDLSKQLLHSQLPATGKAEVVRHLEQAIASGKHWFISLLEAIGLWTDAEEIHNGRHYRYLIAGEAFDWLLLAERLCQAVDGLLPDDERITFLFQGKPPLNLSKDKFRKLIGSGKYHQYLNYFYGVTVEEALILAVHDKVRKERRTAGYTKERDITNEVYRRIYGATKAELLGCFRQENSYPQTRSISLTELKEFTYWLFKYRLKECDKARMASDTKRGLERLQQLETINGFSKGLVTEELSKQLSKSWPSKPEK